MGIALEGAHARRRKSEVGGGREGGPHEMDKKSVLALHGRLGAVGYLDRSASPGSRGRYGTGHSAELSSLPVGDCGASVGLQGASELAAQLVVCRRALWGGRCFARLRAGEA